MSLIFTNQSVLYPVTSWTICVLCDKDYDKCERNPDECFAQFEKDVYSDIFNGTSWICECCSANGTSKCKEDRYCQDKLKRAIYTELIRQNIKIPEYLADYTFNKEKYEEWARKLLDITYIL